MTNTNNKTNARQELYAILETINNKALNTLDALRTSDNVLYNELFNKLQNYINAAVWFDGNKNMTISLLRNKPIEELQSEMLSTLFFKFGLVLANATTDHQFNYINRTIHTILSDYFKTSKLDRETDSLNELQYSGSDDDTELTRLDCFGDYTYNPEYVLIELPERKRQAVAKLNARRKELVLTVNLLKNKRHQLLALLAIDALKIKCKDITSTLINAKDLDTIVGDILVAVGKRYGITNEIAEIMSTSEKKPLSPSAFKLDASTNSDELSKIVAAEVSRLKNRGKTLVKSNLNK